MKNLQADLQADLLADLTPLEVVVPTPVAEPTLPPQVTETTPALSMQWTPLRWSRPKVVKAKDGVGKALKLGPLKLELSVKE
jgi:hypothetical protein